MHASRQTATGTPQEEILCGLFAEVLGRSSVGAEEDFFDLGGDSLIAIQLVNRTRAVLCRAAHVRMVFDAPTPAGLVRLLAEPAGGAPAADRPGPSGIAVPARTPLSAAQQRLWFMGQLEGPTPRYNVPVAVRLRGAVDATALAAALCDVVDRHESLRTVFPQVDGVPFQQVVDPTAVGPLLRRVTVAPDALAPALAGAIDEAFDVTTDVPVRAWDVTVVPDGAAPEHVLLLVLHHIAVDGWSLRPLLGDLASAYAARLGGEAPRFVPLPATYRQYSEWRRTAPDESAPGLQFWRRALDGVPPRLPLPLDRPRPMPPSYHGGGVRFAIDAAMHARLVGLARRRRSTLFMVMQAALAALLTRAGAGPDVSFGVPVACRSHDELDGLVGLVANTLVLRTDTSGDPAFGDLVDRVRVADLAAFAHQEVPFDQVVDAVSPAASRGWNPLVQVSLGLGTSAIDEEVLRGLPGAELYEIDPVMAKFELGMDLRPLASPDGTPSGLAGLVQFSTDLFDRETAEMLATNYIRILDQATADPERTLSGFELVGRPTGGPAVGPVAVTVPERFAAQVRARPEAIALVCGQQELTYRELDRRARALAHRLRALGVGPETPVAVLVERSVELVVSLLAVLQAGGAYVPLERRSPAARKSVVMAESGADVLLVDPASLGMRFDHQGVILVVEPDPGVVPDDLPPVPGHPGQLAYVMFTSGSTGVPKGVGVTHGDVVALASDGAFASAAHRRVLVQASYAFDASTYELWVPLLNGGCCVLTPPGDLDVETLAQTLREHRPTAAAMTTSLFNLMVEEAPAALGVLQEVWTGGEVVSARAIRALRAVEPGTQVVNGYGPTEATTFATRFRVPADGEIPDNVPIGTALDGVRTYVLDNRLRPVEPGGLGELYVAGAGLARGYVGRPAFTAQRFVADPFDRSAGRMYRTGDLVRRTARGELEFAGRNDDQIKIRGFRIEPGEVQAVVQTDPAVSLAAVVGRRDAGDDWSLVAYVVPADGTDGPPLAELRARIAAQLPDYMVPAAIMSVDALPLTANGKLDRAALPQPKRDADPTPAAQRQTPAARTAAEEILCGLFADVLGVGEVGPLDSFFALGGHSMLAMRLVARISSALGVHLTLAQLFEDPTPAGVARTLAHAAGPVPATLPLGRSELRPDLVPLSFAQQRLWFIDQIEGPGVTYNIPLVVRVRGTVDVDALRSALHDLVTRHEALRTVFPPSEGEPRQGVVTPSLAKPELPVLHVAPDALDGELHRAGQHVFDITVDVPLRSWLFEVDGRGNAELDHVLLILVHHVACDGMSLSPLLRDLDNAYRARVAGARPDAEPLLVQYADYTLWQRAMLGDERDASSALAGHLAHWALVLKGMPDELHLPYDRPRPAVASYRGDTVAIVTDAVLHQSVLELARQHNCTLFMVLHAAVAAVLQRCGAGSDIPLGTVVSGRSDAALDDLVGFFVNTLVLRTDVSGDPTFAELLDRTRDVDLDAFGHQDVPFDRLVEQCRPQRSLGRHPLFQVLVALDYGFMDAASRMFDADVVLSPMTTATAKFDLSVDFAQSRDGVGAPSGLRIVLEYATDLFERDTVVGLGDRIVRLLTAVVADPGRRIGGIDLLSTDENDRLLADGDGGHRAEPEQDVPTQVREAANRCPDAVAVSTAGGTTTYAGLSASAGEVCRELLAAGAGPEDVTAVLAERGPWFIGAALGVLDSGGGYLALDPGVPVVRAAGQLRDADVRVLLASPELRERAAAVVAACLDHPVTVLTPGPGEPRKPAPPAVAVPREALAYCVFTSGSTGTPKLDL